MVLRIAACTCGWFANLPSMRAAARSKAVRTSRCGSGLALGPDWVAALACASRSFCKKSFTPWEIAACLWAIAASLFARMLCRMLMAAAAMSTRAKAHAVIKAPRLRRGEGGGRGGGGGGGGG